MRPLYFPRKQFTTITADDVSARRSLAASDAPLGYDERLKQAHIQPVENPHRGSYALVMQEEIHWCAEVASKIGILSVATSSTGRTDPM